MTAIYCTVSEVPDTDGRARYLARINRARCPRSPRWRSGLKHGFDPYRRRIRPSDRLTEARHGEYHQIALTGVVVERADCTAHVSVYDGGKNARVPAGRRAAASREYILARSAKAAAHDRERTA